ncbi:GTPase IMAP family member 8 [Biomphalaria pfeifferi]|uniref:GTPase IMAP family member 8 n=1 Tax=Biomphalaria pfeifferi TaxID=112525 RepID=A0AAD8BVH7_BIOPF|nr:GTPase IMAP family member 8 [Biomphalaria pfeifferi]
MSQIALLTIGYPGNGKSATANTILGYDAFSKNNSTAKIVTEPCVHTSTDKTITVVDGLCLMGLDEDTLFDAQTAVQMCGGPGLSSVLVVLRFGEKFSEEEAKLVEVARNVFGPNILRDFGVCLVTHGDDFKYAVEEGEEDSKTLDVWYQKQKGKLRALFSECGNRCVMFDNRTKDPKEKGRLLNIVRNLSKNGSKRYTTEDFRKLHRRTFPMSHNKQLQMTFRRRLVEIREIIKSNPCEQILEQILRNLGDISEEAKQIFNSEQYIQNVISEVQVLTRSIKPLLRRKRDSDRQFVSAETQEKHDARQKPQSTASDDSMAQKDKLSNDINILVLGRSGNGKSSTGNTILGSPEFRVNAGTTASNSSIESKRNTWGYLSIRVVDGPSLEDAVLEASTNLDKMFSSIKEALQMCNYSFNGLVVVLKFGQRFTKQEKDAIVMIKSILGKDVLRKYGVCVMTYGDNFDNEMEESDGLEFIDWCKQQTGEIADLFQECSYRCVLFDNKTKDEEKQSDQRQTLFRFINSNLKYSEAEFLEAEKDFQDLSLQCAMPLLEQATTTNLARVRDKLQEIELEFPRNDEKYKKELERMKEALQQYRMNLESLGQNSSIDYLKQLVTAVELQINSKLKLCQQTEELKRLDSETHRLRHNVAFTNVPLGDSQAKGPAISLYPGNLLPSSTQQEETLRYIENLREFQHYAFERWKSANTGQPRCRTVQKQELVDDIEARLREAASRGERNETLDALLAHLTEMKDRLSFEIRSDKDVAPGPRSYQHPLETVSVENEFELLEYPHEHTPVVCASYTYPANSYPVSYPSERGYYGQKKSSCISAQNISETMKKLPKTVTNKWKTMKNYFKRLYKTFDQFV